MPSSAATWGRALSLQSEAEARLNVNKQILDTSYEVIKPFKKNLKLRVSSTMIKHILKVYFIKDLDIPPHI